MTKELLGKYRSLVKERDARKTREIFDMLTNYPEIINYLSIKELQDVYQHYFRLYIPPKELLGLSRSIEKEIFGHELK